MYEIKLTFVPGYYKPINNDINFIKRTVFLILVYNWNSVDWNDFLTHNHDDADIQDIRFAYQQTVFRLFGQQWSFLVFTASQQEHCWSVDMTSE